MVAASCRRALTERVPLLPPIKPQPRLPSVVADSYDYWFLVASRFVNSAHSSWRWVSNSVVSAVALYGQCVAIIAGLRLSSITVAVGCLFATVSAPVIAEGTAAVIGETGAVTCVMGMHRRCLGSPSFLHRYCPGL